MSAYKLSILIPTIVGRETFLSELVCELIRQCGGIRSMMQTEQSGCIILIIGFDDAEIIVAKDNRQISTGVKRNLLLGLAKHHYVVQIDDDDYVYPYYFEEIIKAIQSFPDCVGTKGYYSMDGGATTEWRLSKDYPNETIFENGTAVYIRTTNHISPVKRTLALQAGFPDKSNAEDKEFSIRLQPLLKTEVKIDRMMYHYRYSSQNKSYT